MPAWPRPAPDSFGFPDGSGLYGRAWAESSWDILELQSPGGSVTAALTRAFPTLQLLMRHQRKGKNMSAPWHASSLTRLIERPQDQHHHEQRPRAAMLWNLHRFQFVSLGQACRSQPPPRVCSPLRWAAAGRLRGRGIPGSAPDRPAAESCC